MTEAYSYADALAVGELIRKAREGPGLKINGLASLTGISRHTLGQLEKGLSGNDPFRTSTKTLVMAAYVLDVTPDQLRRVGRDDAADVLSKMLARERARREHVRVWGADRAVLDALRGKHAEMGTGPFYRWVESVVGVDRPTPDEGKPEDVTAG